MRTNKSIPFLIALTIHALLFIPLLVGHKKISSTPTFTFPHLQGEAIEVSSFKVKQKSVHSLSKTVKNISPNIEADQELNNSTGQTSNNTKDQNQIQFTQFKEPNYPPISRANGEEGVVRIRVYYNELGEITNSELIQSSGKPLLDLSAQKAILSWRLTPSPTRGMFEKSFVFKLKN